MTWSHRLRTRALKRSQQTAQPQGWERKSKQEYREWLTAFLLRALNIIHCSVFLEVYKVSCAQFLFGGGLCITVCFCLTTTWRRPPLTYFRPNKQSFPRTRDHDYILVLRGGWKDTIQNGKHYQGHWQMSGAASWFAPKLLVQPFKKCDLLIWDQHWVFMSVVYHVKTYFSPTVNLSLRCWWTPASRWSADICASWRRGLLPASEPVIKTKGSRLATGLESL